MQNSSVANLPFLKTIFPFYLLNEEDLQDIVQYIERRNFPEGTVLFQPGQFADYFYLLQSGTVKIRVSKKEEYKELSILAGGDVFGEEALHVDATYKTEATAASRIIVAAISADHIHLLEEKYPLLREAFQLLSNSARLVRRLNLPWHGPEEPVILATRRHPFFLLIRIVFMTLLTLAAFAVLLYLSFTSKSLGYFFLFTSILSLGIGGFFGGWAALEWSNDYLFITRERVITERQIIGFFEGRQESPMSAILSTGTDSSIWGRTIGFGTITVRSYTGDLRMERLPFPNLIYGILESRRQRLTMEQRREEQGRIQEALNQRLNPDPNHNSRPAGTHPSRQSQNGIYGSNSISDLLARFFNLRIESDRSVTYHTHWIKLIQKTFLPAMLLVAVVLAVLARLTGILTFFSEPLVYSLALLGTVIGWGWWVYEYLDWFNDVYIITADQLVDLDRKPLGYEERRSAPLKNIQTVEYRRNGLIGLILNYGTVHIQIGNEELTFDNVYNPSAVQREIYARFTAYNQRVKHAEQERLADWIQTYDRLHRNERSQNR